MNYRTEPVRAVSKQSQLFNDRKGKKTQRMRGSISPSVRSEVKARSGGWCEVRKRCKSITEAVAVHMAHIQSRNTIEETTAGMLLHACYECHYWMDFHPDGIKYKRRLRDEQANNRSPNIKHPR